MPCIDNLISYFSKSGLLLCILLFPGGLFAQSDIEYPECYSHILSEVQSLHAVSAAAYEDCIRSSLLAGDTAVGARLLMKLGESLMLHGQLDSATTYLTMSYEIYDSLNDDWNRAKVLNQLSLTYLRKGDFETSRSVLTQAIELAQQPQFRDSIHPYFGFMGQVMATLRDFEQSDVFFTRGVDMLSKGNRSIDLKVCYYGWAVSKLSAQDSKSADSLIQLANRIHVPESERLRLKIMQTRAEARLYNTRGEFNKTLETYESLLSTTLSDMYYDVKVEAFMGMANAHTSLREFEQANELYDSILSDSMLYQNPLLIEGVLRRYATFLDEVEDYEGASWIKSRIIWHTDSIYDQHRLDEIRSSQLHDLEQSNFELFDENVEKSKLIDYYVEIDKFWRRLIYIGTSFIIVLSILVYYLFRTRKQLRESEHAVRLNNEKLEEVDRQRIQLVRILGHDLRGPMWGLRSFIERMNAGDISEQDEKKMRAHAFNSMLEIQDMLEDLSAWAEASAGVLISNKENIELRALVDSLLGAYRLHALVKNLDIRIEIDEDLEVISDRRALSTILRNLIENAIKHTAEGTVVIQAERREETVSLSIRDTGHGMEAETLHALRAQSAFKRTEGTHGEGGTGLGMSAVFLLAREVGVHIHIDSKVNEGTTIQIEPFPVA